MVAILTGMYPGSVEIDNRVHPRTLRFQPGFDVYRDTDRDGEYGYLSHLLTAEDLDGRLFEERGPLDRGGRFFAALVLVDLHRPYPEQEQVRARVGDRHRYAGHNRIEPA